MPKILHIFNFEEKFSKPFFQFLQDNDFDLSQHQLFHYGKHNSEYKKFNMKFTFARYYSVIKHLQLLRDMFKSKQIIVHSLASPWLLLYLYLFPSLTKKVYWVIWGKDLYFFKLLKKKRFYHYIYEHFRKNVFKNIKHVVTYIRGDYELANSWYGTTAIYHECLMYPSNLYKDYKLSKKPTKTLTIQVGNSADPSNNHSQIFTKLKKFKEKNIQIIAPLSYGNKEYAKDIIKLGKSIFGNKFNPLTEFMPYKEYLELLNNIDIAIFSHDRQQAMGNIITLLSLGKKIYLKPQISSTQMFKDYNITVFDVTKEISLSIDVKLNEINMQITKEHFSKSKYIQQLNNLYVD